MQGLATIPDHTLMLAVTHPDSVKVVHLDRFLIDLARVDENGYGVYTNTFTLSHLIVVDPGNPDVDISGPVLRSMRFGRSLLDLDFMLQRKHGDVFYISYGTGVKFARTIMILVMDPTIVRKEFPDAEIV
jgi:hypothetical protein